MSTKMAHWIGVVALAAPLLACSESRTTGRDAGRADGGADGNVVTDASSSDSVVQLDTLAADTYHAPAHWETVASMNQARLFHSATRLQDGRVLVVGGYSHDGVVGRTAEIHDPADGSWTPTGEMSQGHQSHIAALLPDGRVLVAGGCPDSWDNTCSVGVGVDLFDPGAPAGQRWQPGEPMIHDRVLHCSTTLEDGRVLVAGGWASTTNHRSLELHDGPSGQWTPVAATMSTPRNGCTATTLSSGKVLIAGGHDSTLDVMVDSLEVYDPGNGTISLVTDALPEGRMRHDAALLGDGRVLATGGADTAAEAWIFDHHSSAWSAAPDMPATFHFHRAVRLEDGSVLLIGGDGGTLMHEGSASAARFVP